MPALTRTLVRVAAAAVLATALGACTAGQAEMGGPDGRATSLGTTPAPGGPSSTNTPSAPDEYPDDAGYPSGPAVPSPDTGQITQLVTQLGAVAPALVADPALIAQQAQETCQDIADGKSDTIIAGNVTERFTVPGGPEVTQEQGTRILDAVRTTACAG